ncbi:MAG: hypothetical protein LAO03_22630 [Acidobacteriia bacterium]|nr:hypothetical protein [Terriglobia bacterium]
MLTEDQANRVWERMVESEVRSLYFADLASRNTTRKQIIIGTSFFLASGAFATLIARLPVWLPTICSLLVALLTAYSMAVGLERRIGTLTKLHCQWNSLFADYERLWNHWQDEDAEEVLERLIRRANEASELATEMPNDPKSINKWAKIVYARFSPVAA